MRSAAVMIGRVAMERRGTRKPLPRPLAWLGIGLMAAACGSEPAPPRKLDWGTGGMKTPLPPASGVTFDGAVAPPRADGAAHPVACVDDGPCGGYTCNLATGICRAGCTMPEDCSSGHTCHAPTSRCLLATPCQEDSPCGGYLCDRARGACEVSCTFSLTCAPGYLCEPGGACQP